MKTLMQIYWIDSSVSSRLSVSLRTRIRFFLFLRDYIRHLTPSHPDFILKRQFALQPFSYKLNKINRRYLYEILKLELKDAYNVVSKVRYSKVRYDTYKLSMKIFNILPLRICRSFFVHNKKEMRREYDLKEDPESTTK